MNNFLSLGLAPNNMFYGLVIDEDNQYEQTENRIDKWVKQIKKELYPCREVDEIGKEKILQVKKDQIFQDSK